MNIKIRHTIWLWLRLDGSRAILLDTGYCFTQCLFSSNNLAGSAALAMRSIKCRSSSS